MPNLSSDALRALTQFLVSDASMGDTLHRVADLTGEALPAAAFVGVSMLSERGVPTTAVFTDEQAPLIDQAQYESGQGPCLDAWRERRSIRLDDLAEVDDRYAPFAGSCLDHGIHSTLSMPLVAAGTGVGALNLYSRTAGGFTSDDEEVAADLCSVASAVLSNSLAYWGAYDLGQQMSEAMQSRAVIEQAKGMLMAGSPGMSADEAFDVLRRASQRENVKLREIAVRLVERRSSAGGTGLRSAEDAAPPR